MTSPARQVVVVCSIPYRYSGWILPCPKKMCAVSTTHVPSLHTSGGTLYAAASLGDRTPDLGFGCLAAVVGNACTRQTQGGVCVQFSQIHHLANHQPSARAQQGPQRRQDGSSWQGDVMASLWRKTGGLARGRRPAWGK